MTIGDIRARESILIDKTILEDTGELKESVTIIAIAKRAKVGEQLTSSPTVALVTPPDQADLESMVNKLLLERRGGGGLIHPSLQ